MVRALTTFVVFVLLAVLTPATAHLAPVVVRSAHSAGMPAEEEPPREARQAPEPRVTLCPRRMSPVRRRPLHRAPSAPAHEISTRPVRPCARADHLHERTAPDVLQVFRN
ncbi:hypothetical protein GCM10022243_24120 [Saccharothrix violaceirubra]|uniref:Secreted protein n=1 Tax=Saccharothrix violaceirubra TaxID=413306 RepID=A0A7W7T8C2_9PSEU|nr:hypothetical protein [Saccharothrix violaceirubra]MBB4967857.1 hypothetical protein [Saccharothrix violaceirubra]